MVKPQTALDHSPLARLVGSSPAMRGVHDQITRVGRSRLPVLILGETGTGKEVVARAIHDMNPQGKFVVVDCSALVGELMESELFGHERGAFTGAVGQKSGLLEEADGGTAFFDEIGELPIELQQKLLRVLQEKQFRPVGSRVQRRSDFRILAATNRNLPEEIKAKRFREDLYYRLNGKKLRLAPLRERREDIAALITHFLQKYGNGHRLADELMNSLLTYDWPGNIRELENTVHQMVAMNSGPWLTEADLPSTLVNRGVEKRLERETTEAAAPQRDSWETPKQILPLKQVEKRAIIEALDAAKGDRTLAAGMLGIGRTTLYRKLKLYRL